MPDDWAVGELDLDSYLDRIGYVSPAKSAVPSGEILAALHRAHLAAIPFENLDIMLGRPVRVDLGSIQAKLVHGRRGGYCYEHGHLFAAALVGRTYTVTRPGHVKERAELGDAEFAAALADVFGLSFSRAELDRLVATVS